MLFGPANISAEDDLRTSAGRSDESTDVNRVGPKTSTPAVYHSTRSSTAQDLLKRNDLIDDYDLGGGVFQVST